MELQEGMGGVASEEPDCVEMEAAEQLIQLSGGGDDDGNGEGSESCKSADSVKAGGPKPLPRQGDDGNKEGAPAVEVESSSSSRPRPGKSGPEKGGGIVVDGSGGVNEEEAVIGGGERRRRPRFWSLAAIYRETRRVGGVRCCPREEAAAREDGKRRNDGKRRPAADGTTAGEAVPVAACKARRLVSRPKD